MIVQSWVDVLQQSFTNLLASVISFLPSFVFAVIIFVVGWFIGALLGRIIAQAVRSIKVDQALRSAGVGDIVSRAGYTLDSGAFLGGLVQWFVIIVFLMWALQVLALTPVTLFLQQMVVSFLPQVIVAVMIVLIGAVLAELVQNVVTGAARAAGIRSAGFAGAIARWSIWIFAIAVALSQLGIGAQYFQTLFMGIVVALSLAFGLSFGLGGQEAASRFIEKTREGLHKGNQ
ncbi:MAG: small-conductance mechanosensitive ion channel [Parcubacteria group bacterium Gr01-1014_56]|nr:MAG: small-conductance mechanosensitive ion channel [Parcubacteria group bacterium Gr01-1014_56]